MNIVKKKIQKETLYEWYNEYIPFWNLISFWTWEENKITISSQNLRQNHQIGSLLLHFYLPRTSVILLQNPYLRGMFHQNATRGVTWQDDETGVEVVAYQAQPLVVGPDTSLFPIKLIPLRFIFTQKRWSELSWNVLKHFIPVRITLNKLNYCHNNFLLCTLMTQNNRHLFLMSMYKFWLLKKYTNNINNYELN